MFDPVKLTRNVVKRKFIYSCYGMAFDRARSKNFGNKLAWNAVILGVDKSSLRHSKIMKIRFLVLRG